MPKPNTTKMRTVKWHKEKQIESINRIKCMLEWLTLTNIVFIEQLFTGEKQ